MSGEEYRNLATILDRLDALVYVADMQTHELLYLNAYGRQHWGNPGRGRRCWEVLQQDQQGPCSFCNNDKLLGSDGKPNPPYIWEFQNTVTGRWYQCRDQAITWSDGRLVRLEIATDITERKRIEQELTAAMHQAHTLAYTDALTGLMNRRAFFEWGADALAQARRQRSPVAIIMFDVDNFKRINDSLGHAVGDHVLQVLAERVKPLARSDDLLARLGGEEFGLMLPQATQSHAQAVGESIRLAINSAPIRYEGGNLYCTCSFGIAASHDGSAELETLLRDADHAMLAAKASGRDRIVTAAEPSPPRAL